MKILFVDNERDAFDAFCKLPFGEKHIHETTYRDSPVGLGRVVAENADLKLVVLDVLWHSAPGAEGLPLGVDAMRELARDAPDVPVVIYSVIDSEEVLRNYIPEMIRLGAHDWISKIESRPLRSFRFEQAYNLGRDVRKRPAGRAILSESDQSRSNVHVAVLFIDMSGFTALTDKVGAADTVDILREFYRLVSDAVSERGGYLDKYIGDAAMAVFGASEAQNNSYSHVNHCVDAARHILGNATPFRLTRVEPRIKRVNLQGTPDEFAKIGRFRVGIESGPVEVVRFERGAEWEITFVGNPVNIASRLLSHAKPDEAWIGVNVHTNGAVARIVAEEAEVAYKNLPGSFSAYRIRV